MSIVTDIYVDNGMLTSMTQLINLEILLDLENKLNTIETNNPTLIQRNSVNASIIAEFRKCVFIR